MKPLVIIPARGGSKRVPGKNIKRLGGKPLFQYTVEAALEVFPADVICFSTDSQEMKMAAENMGLQVPFLRPVHLATDEAGSYGVLIHAIEFYESQGYYPDTIILLQVTSPFRGGQHIREALALFDNDCEMVISVKATRTNPFLLLREENAEGWLAKPLLDINSRRQDVTKFYELNGSIYIMHKEILIRKSLSEMEKVRKYLMDETSSIDIDTEIDWKLAEMIINSQTA